LVCSDTQSNISEDKQGGQGEEVRKQFQAILLRLILSYSNQIVTVYSNSNNLSKLKYFNCFLYIL